PARGAGQAAARGRGGRDRAGRWSGADPGGRPHHRRDQPRPARGDGRGPVPRRSVLPAERGADPHAAAARPARRHPRAGGALHGAAARAPGPDAAGPLARRTREHEALRLARQRPRAREHLRAARDPVPRRRRRRPGARAGAAGRRCAPERERRAAGRRGGAGAAGPQRQDRRVRAPPHPGGALGRRRQHRRGRAPPAHGPAQPLPSHEAPGDRTMSVRVSTRPLAALAAALLAAAPLAAQPGAEAGPELTADAADAVLSLYNRATTVRLHGESILPAGTELAGDLGVLDGPLVLAGRVRGSVVVINGDLRFEPGAEVGGDVIVVGGIVHGLASARVHGTATVYREPLRYRRDGDLLVQAPLPEKGSGLSAGRDFR